MEQKTRPAAYGSMCGEAALELLEHELEYAHPIDENKIRRQINAHKRHMKKCGRADMERVDPFGVRYKCRTCGDLVYGARYLVSGLSAMSDGAESGGLGKGVEVLDAFTGVWHVVGDDGTIPHGNNCHHCGQDMGRLDPETASMRFDPAAPEV